MSRTLNAFLKENANKPSRELYKVAISDRFLDENNEPILWELESLPPKQYMKIINGSPKKMNARTSEVTLDDHSASLYELIGKCVKYPDLRDTELQDSYGVTGVPDLVDAMLNAKEFVFLNEVLTKIHSSDKDINDLVEEVKN